MNLSRVKGVFRRFCLYFGLTKQSYISLSDYSLILSLQNQANTAHVPVKTLFKGVVNRELGPKEEENIDNMCGISFHYGHRLDDFIEIVGNKVYFKEEGIGDINQIFSEIEGKELEEASKQRSYVPKVF